MVSPEPPMNRIVECLANFSEGRREDVVAALAEAIAGQGAQVIDLRLDAQQNRSLIRFAGTPEKVEAAALAACGRAFAAIDMAAHRGSHPRIGAVDILPLVPVANISLAECVDLAHRLAARIAQQHRVPVYLGGDAALRPERHDPAAIRAGEYEGLASAIGSDPARAPDFGPASLGPAGACIVAARPARIVAVIGIAGLSDPRDLPDVAAAYHGPGGGLPSCECQVREDGGSSGQLALTLHDPERMPLHRVLALLNLDLRRRGASLASVEIAGPVPQGILDAAARWQLQIRGPLRSIEALMAAPSEAVARPSALDDFLDRLASDDATPGGGSVAALAGALSAALCAMVTGLTIGRERYAEREADMIALRGQADDLRRELAALVEADGEAFTAVMAAYQLPKVTAADQADRREAIQAALRQATQVPLDTLSAVLRTLEAAVRIAQDGNPSAVSDAGVAGYLALAAARSAALNVEINVMGLRDLDEGDRFRRQTSAALRQAESLADEVERRVRSRIARNQ